jgi:hypothetical protein
MAEKRLRDRVHDTTKGTAWYAAAALFTLDIYWGAGRVMYPPTSTAPIAATAPKASKPKLRPRYDTVSPKRVTAFVDSFTRKIVRLEESSPQVNLLEPKDCGRKSVKPKARSTKPNASVSVNILSKNKRDGYYFTIDYDKGQVEDFDAGQGPVPNNCAGLVSRDQDINFNRDGNGWFMQVDYSYSIERPERYKNYETNPLSPQEALSPAIFHKYTEAADRILRHAIDRSNVGHFQGYPS